MILIAKLLCLLLERTKRNTGTQKIMRKRILNIHLIFVFAALLFGNHAHADYIWNGNLTGSGNPGTGGGTGNATGSIGTVNMTLTDLDDSNIEWLFPMFDAGAFPAQYGITSVTTLREEQGNQYRLTFAEAVDNPLVAISSLGNGITPNRFIFNTFTTGGSTGPGTVDILWQQNQFPAQIPGTYETSAGVNGSLTGVTFYEAREGFFVSRVNATDVTEIVFSLLNPETYMTIVVGFDEAADPAQSTIIAGPTTVVADGTSTSTITVQLKDKFGNLFRNGGDTVVISSNFGVVTNTTDNGNGTYTATITSSTPRLVTISATLNGAPITGGGTQNVTFIQDPNAPESVQPVPVMGVWSLGVLAGLVGLIGIRKRMR